MPKPLNSDYAKLRRKIMHRYTRKVNDLRERGFTSTDEWMYSFKLGELIQKTITEVFREAQEEESD